MEDDDEFGDLYTDVIRPIEAQRGGSVPAAAAVKAAPSQARPIDLDIDSDDEKTSDLNPASALGWNSNSSSREITLPARGGSDLNLDSNSEAARIAGLIGKGGDGSDFESRVLKKGHGFELGGKATGESTFMEDDDDDINIIVEEREDKDDDLVVKDCNLMNEEDKKSASAVQGENTVNFVNDAAVDEMGPEPIIPGLSERLENPRASNIEDEWESEESDDDLQIVQRMMDEQEWGGEEGGTGADGEKDLGDASKASGGGGGAAPAAVQPKIVYSNPAYHHPFSSQFKYVRPGAAPLPGPTPGGSPGQVRPPISMGPLAGRGRGDWRPAGIKGALPMQKGYQPGYGTLARGVNAAGRGYGSGLDFTLPSHNDNTIIIVQGARGTCPNSLEPGKRITSLRTIFEVDIDSFEEKPWKLPGIDVSDFFNFGLNEDSWRDYCKQLEQLRLEMTMQSKIRVHESGRAVKGYDPDLPPELAAAVGIQDNPSENANHGKTDAGPPDLARRTSLPVGRPIPVETGAGDRLPSIDTRRPRMHDMDAIIEIVCHSSLDSEHDNDPARKDHLGGGGAGGLQQDDADRMDSFSPEYNGSKRVFDSRRPLSKNTADNDDIVTEDVPHHPSEVTGHSHPDRDSGLLQEERSTKGRRHARSPLLSASENKREHIAHDLKEESFRTGDGKQSPTSSSSHSIRSDRERAVVVGDEMDDGSLMDDRSFDMERVEMTSDPPSMGTCEDGNLNYTTKKQKLSSRAEHYSLENEDGKDSKAVRSNDSKARSGSSEHIWSSPDDVDDGVLQHRHPLRAGNIRREVGDDESAHRKDRYDRVEAGRQNMVVKGRGDSFPRRGGDANSSLHWHGKTERADWKESDISDGTWNRRDEDHRGRRTRLDDPRKREHGSEISSRNWDKPGERVKSEKHETHQSRNQLDNGSWRGTNHECDIIGSRQRDNRDDHLKSRSERVDDLRSTKRKEESHMRQVHVEKDDISHNHIESSTGRKRERDDGSDKLKRDDLGRSKDDEVHYARQKEGWSRRERSERQRERDDWYRIKQDDHLSRKEKVDKRPVKRSGLTGEEKKWIIHSRGHDDYKGSSREYHPKDIDRHGDQLKPRDRVENDFSQHRNHGDVYARRNQLSNDEKRTRFDKPTNCDERVSYGPDTSRTHEHKRKEASRKSKETDSEDHSSLIPPKRNQDEDGGSVSETVNLSGRTEQQSSRGHVNHQSSRKHREDALTDDEQPDSRTGRSKLERWTSHKERDFAMTPTPSSSLKKRDRDTHNNSGGSLVTGALEDPSEKIEDKPQPLVDRKDCDPETNDNGTKAVKDRHLDTVAKLKKRSERFKLPMPVEKDAIAVKTTEESEPSPVGQTETHPDSEIKSERPPRKRRWTGN
ncbi:hypothetical protein C2S53_005277 [Perilla frutescens var. hirtella]|uniref:Pre-mRNA polyadenylation factor Fip1 domain-containing protein n=1 Tax=Perilla frutescens var. hirtella TaxID=608512 RepID=A0AAD4J5B9_PERFH|nr:hypothetical protein C2S53_005277 [Perilla frutescens var. hirtella]